MFDGNKMDEILHELYTWCEKEEVPVTAHCMMNGIEAYPHASFHFGSASFWREVLDQYPNLHLNLAHFGWNPVPGHGYGSHHSWTQEICDMVIKYDHLYADVAHHEVTSRIKLNELRDAYRQIANEFAGGVDKIRKRILYGSDWHVLRRINNYESFMDKYIQLLEDTEFYSNMDDFLGLNAMEFLGLNKGGKNRRRLEKFYSTPERQKPRWLE